MKTTAFDNTVATAVENAVMEVYGCELHDIIQFLDSEVKKVVVFLLFHHYGFNWRVIGWNYKITYLYVPTVTEMVLMKCKTDSVLKEKIDRVLSIVENLKIAV